MTKKKAEVVGGVTGGLLPMLAQSGGQFPFFKLEEGQRKRIRFLLTAEEGRAAMTHTIRVNGRFVGTFTCLGTSDCPGCERGDRSGYKGYIPVLDYEGDMVGMMAGGKRMFGAVAKLHQAFGDVRFRDAIIERTGSGFKTQYAILPAVKKGEYAALIEKIEGDDISDTAKILLSGDVDLPSIQIDDKGIEVIRNSLSLDSLEAEGVFEVIRDPLLKIVTDIVTPPPVDQINAMYDGRGQGGDGGNSEESKQGDFV